MPLLTNTHIDMLSYFLSIPPLSLFSCFPLSPPDFQSITQDIGSYIQSIDIGDFYF